MWKVALVLVALMLAGCASDPAPADDAAPTTAGSASAAPFLAAPEPLRFAAGNYEGNMTGEATFSITDQAIVGVSPGVVTFDLSDIIPADAPVELVVNVEGARADLEFIDASSIGGDNEFNGQGTNFAALVVRGSTGQVLLHIYNPGGFSIPPQTNPTASFAAQSVIRPDVVSPYMPVALQLAVGQSVNVTGTDIDEVLILSPTGTFVRDQAEPFEFTANDTAGTYVVVVSGDDAVRLYGPNTTLVAKRIASLEEEPRPLTSGTATTWTFDAPSRPLLVGVELSTIPNAGFFGVGSAMTQYELSVTAPGNVGVLQASDTCTPLCSFGLVGFSFFTFTTDYLDEGLVAGTYDVSVTYTGNNMQASSWALVIA